MAAFGYGKKSDFTKGLKTPAPTDYYIKSEIDISKSKNKGKSFGESRSKMNKSGIISGNTNPG